MRLLQACRPHPRPLLRRSPVATVSLVVSILISIITATFQLTALSPTHRTPPYLQTVPADAARYGLSQIVNHLLSLDQVVPFEFLVNDEILCTSLGSHISSRAISTEGVLEMEYFPAVLPPTPKDAFVHDDWISCVTVVRSSTISKQSSPPSTSRRPDKGWSLASGCYAGLVKFWNSAGEVDRQYVAHDYPIKSCSAVNEMQLITTADDGSVHVWDVADGSDDGNHADGTRLVARLSGHRSSVESSCVRPDGERCATSGWDKNVLVWKSGESLISEADNFIVAEPKMKRKKRAKSSEPSLEEKVSNAPHIQSLGTLDGHAQAVSGLKWVSQEHLVSSSWDHTVKLWDVEMETALDTFTHNKVIYCLDTPNAPNANTNANLIAFGGAEKGLRLWDRRDHQKQGTFTRALQTFQSHTSWISDVKWHPSSEHTILTASFDGSIKLWDVRSAIPLWTVDVDDEADKGGKAGKEDGHKLFCCTWVDDKTVAAGGDNRTIAVFTHQP